MKIPKTIKIGAYDIQVEKVAPEDCTDEWGAANLLYQKIRLRNNLPESLEAQIFLHEIVEMGLKRLDIGDVPHHSLSLIAEELFTIIRNNKLDFLNKG